MDVIYKLSPQHISELHELYQNEWWTKGRTLKESEQCVEGSQVCIGLIDEAGTLQGFARVLTDYIFKALIFDVIVSPKYRGKGLGDKLVNLVKNHQKLSNVKCFELYCLPELTDFYDKHNFTTDVGNISLMRCINV